MKTPCDYIKSFKDGLISEAMTSDVLYSYSKRAKNYRDKIREYKQKLKNNWFYYDKYDYLDKLKEKEELLYKKKSDILNFCKNKLICIHKQPIPNRMRIYDYEEEYKDALKRKSEIVWRNSYYDHRLEKEVNFVDTLKGYKYLYFLFYELPKHSFHQPIDDKELENYNWLETKEIEDLTTFGEDITELLSLQFCDKVYKTIIENNKQLF